MVKGWLMKPNIGHFSARKGAVFCLKEFAA
jgi:hypothetical protein